MPIVSSSISPVYTGDIVQILNDQAMQTIVLWHVALHRCPTVRRPVSLCLVQSCRLFVSHFSVVIRATFALSSYSQLGEENCALLDCYAASSGNSVPSFRDSLSVPSSVVQKSSRIQKSWPLKMEPIVCPETPLRNYHYSLFNSPEERSSDLLSFGSLKSRNSVKSSFLPTLF